MRYLLNLLLISILFMHALFGQEMKNQIRISKDKKGEKTYLYNGVFISRDSVISLVRSKPESSQVYEKSFTQSKALRITFFGTMIFGAATVSVLIPARIVASTPDSQDHLLSISKTLGIITASCAVPCIILIFSHDPYYFNKSIKVFNKTDFTGAHRNVTLYYGFTGVGVGLKVRF